MPSPTPGPVATVELDVRPGPDPPDPPDPPGPGGFWGLLLRGLVMAACLAIGVLADRHSGDGPAPPPKPDPAAVPSPPDPGTGTAAPAGEIPGPEPAGLAPDPRGPLPAAPVPPAAPPDPGPAGPADLRAVLILPNPPPGRDPGPDRLGESLAAEFRAARVGYLAVPFSDAGRRAGVPAALLRSVSPPCVLWYADADRLLAVDPADPARVLRSLRAFRRTGPP